MGGDATAGVQLFVRYVMKQILNSLDPPEPHYAKIQRIIIHLFNFRFLSRVYVVDAMSFVMQEIVCEECR